MTQMNTFAALLDRDQPILIDGGLATQCEAMGCDIDDELWSATLLQSNPRAIVDAHRAYLDAGAKIIITASYQVSRAPLLNMGLSAKRADDEASRPGRRAHEGGLDRGRTRPGLAGRAGEPQVRAQPGRRRQRHAGLPEPRFYPGR